MANLRVNNIFGESGKDSNGSALFDGSGYLTAANASAFRAVSYTHLTLPTILRV